jgi:hypothetical protein
MKKSFKGASAPTFGDPPETELVSEKKAKVVKKPEKRDSNAKSVNVDKAVSRGYSLPASFHDVLRKKALERSLSEDKSISASQVLYEAAKKGLGL